MEKNKKNISGFTLIELLVVATITISVTGMSLAWYSHFDQDKILNKQIEDFVQIIEMAKNKAYAGDVSTCGAADGITPHLQRYSVIVDSTNIKTIPVCVGSPTGYVYPIKDHLVFLTPTMEISFGLFGKLEGEKSRCIPIQNTDSNKCRYVGISENGLVTTGTCSSCSPITCSCL